MNGTETAVSRLALTAFSCARSDTCVHKTKTISPRAPKNHPKQNPRLKFTTARRGALDYGRVLEIDARFESRAIAPTIGYMPDPAADVYVMGHTDRERRRLALQASILQPFTEQLFRRAGIATGMHVLDVGCGVGDVSLLAARLIGRTGSVTSIDIDPA